MRASDVGDKRNVGRKAMRMNSRGFGGGKKGGGWMERSLC